MSLEILKTIKAMALLIAVDFVDGEIYCQLPFGFTTKFASFENKKSLITDLGKKLKVKTREISRMAL